MANSERGLPRAWLSPDRLSATDTCARYAKPLIGDQWSLIPLERGLQRFARLCPIVAPKRCKPYQQAAFRESGVGSLFPGLM